MNKEKETFSEEIYGTILNGRVDFENDGKNLLSRKQATYYNPKTDKMQTQNYFYMEDIVVPVILRINENGELEFAMQYEYIPAVDKVLLELPDVPFFGEKKAEYTNADVTDAVDNRMISLGLEMQGFKYLDSSETAVSQSFTDQRAKYVAVYVEEETKNDKLQWFPITSLRSYLDTIGSNSSIQTKYALQRFYAKYKNQIQKDKQTSFNYDNEIVGKPEGEWKDKKNIMKHQYRFGIELAENDRPEKQSEKVPNYGQISEYGLSKNAANCLIVKKEKNKIKIGLAKQQRSPFVDREGVNKYFYEFVGGMVEDGESYEAAAKREAVEEAGIAKEDIEKLIHIEPLSLISKGTAEYDDFYICEINENIKINSLALDEQEDIDTLEWFDLYEIDLEKMNIPTGTKLIIEKARLYYEERRKEKERTSEEVR